MSLDPDPKKRACALRRSRSSSWSPPTDSLPRSSQPGVRVPEGTVHDGIASPRTFLFSASACGSPERHEAADAGLKTGVRPLRLAMARPDFAWGRAAFTSLRYYAAPPRTSTSLSAASPKSLPLRSPASASLVRGRVNTSSLPVLLLVGEPIGVYCPARSRFVHHGMPDLPCVLPKTETATSGLGAVAAFPDIEVLRLEASATLRPGQRARFHAPEGAAGLSAF